MGKTERRRSCKIPSSRHSFEGSTQDHLSVLPSIRLNTRKTFKETTNTPQCAERDTQDHTSANSATLHKYCNYVEMTTAFWEPRPPPGTISPWASVTQKEEPVAQRSAIQRPVHRIQEPLLPISCSVSPSLLCCLTRTHTPQSPFSQLHFLAFLEWKLLLLLPLSFVCHFDSKSVLSGNRTAGQKGLRI